MKNSRQRTSVIEMKRQRRVRFHRAIAVLGCMVVFVTALALMVPAISITQDAAQPEGGFYRDASQVASVDAGEASGGQSDAGAAGQEAGEAAASTDREFAGAVGDIAATNSESEGTATSDADSNQGDGVVASDDADTNEAAADNPDEESDDVQSKTAAADHNANPEQSFSGSLKDEHGNLIVAVEVEAPEGALPDGASMKVLPVTNDKVIGAAQQKGAQELKDAAIAAGKSDQEAADEVRQARTLPVAVTFVDAQGAEVKPTQDVRMTINAPTVGVVQDDDRLAVVNLDADTVKKAGGVEADKSDANDGSVDAAVKKASVKAFAERVSDDVAVVPADELDVDRDNQKVSFDANDSQVFAIVYTVDFHYEADGQTYDYSISGGNCVALSDLVKVLGVAADANLVSDGEDAGVTIDMTDDADADADADAAVRQFMRNVANVEFSNPELVSVSKADADMTVGAIKDALGLECEYSGELTEDQIAEINAAPVSAGDWAIIGLKAFDSEEALTVTMEDGSTFAVKVTDDQLKTYAISDSGDTYEIIVTYDDAAEIPENAELKVREIKDSEEAFTANVKATNEQLQALEKPDVTNPVQFDIAIISDGKEVEPKEGSIVKVEIRLAPEVFVDEAAEDNQEEGEIWLNGENLGLSERYGRYTVAHISADGTAEIVNDVRESVIEDEKIVLRFETESFSDYLFDGNNGSGFNNLPSTIYVGDEIYMWNQANYWVTNIGSVVSETKHDNGWDPDGWGSAQPDSSNYKTVTALTPGKFRIVHKNDWNNGNPYQNYKEITVLPARTGTTPPDTINTINNADIGLTLNLFDYDLDNYLDDYYNGASHYDNTCISDFAGHGINSGNALKFWGSGIGNNYGSLNQYVEHGVTSIVNNTLNSSGYPVLSNSSGGSGNRDLSYLFTPSDGTDKRAYTNVDGLFKKVGDYYVYDSDQNYAYYDVEQGNGGSFAVYDGTYKQKSRGDGGEQASHTADKSIGFFPFHKWDDQYDLYVNWNKNLNHHFGMSMSVDFSLPKDPKAVVDTDGNPIVFEFSGDDDMWVFIDGKLAMDIGGIHQPTSGTINFKDQSVIVNGARQNGFNFSNLYDGKKHKLQVFYIERGGCDSNCMIKFNLTQYGDVHFDKVDKDNQSDKLAGAVFGIYKDNACSDPLKEQLKNGTSRAYVAESNAQGRVQFSDIPLGTYYLKELHAPEGYPLDSTVHTVNVYLDQTANEVKVTIDGTDVGTGVNILNGKPAPINLGLKKDWQDADGRSIGAPDGVTATFEIKRIRTYEKYTERTIEGQGLDVSHLTVGWIHNGETHVYEEFDLIAGSQATVSWGYANGYTGSKDCIKNGEWIDKDYVTGNIVSEAFDMPAAGGSATFYIVDESEAGDAIRNINVAGQQFYGNSGGGIIHTFETITEPDASFSYTGEHVTDNRITLPIDEDTWQYVFRNLPTFGRGIVEGVDHEVAFNYTYYLEEISNTAPEGTTVVYKDLSGNEINSASDAETHTSGTQTIINKIPFGYLKIEKKVTYNSSDENLTTAQKSKLAGEYKFKIYTKEQCGDADAVRDPNAAVGAQDNDLIITITIGENGQAVRSDAVKLLAGKYWIKEVESSNPAMFPVDNPIAVTVTKDDTTTKPAISSLTNNYDESNGPDKIAIDIEKKFQGLDANSQVPANFQLLLQYTVGGQAKTVTLHNATVTGENGEKISWTESGGGFTWHWKVTNIPSEATDFKLKEVNYDKAKGYDWKSATLNGADITSTVTDWHDLRITAPAATLSNVTSNRRTSDSGQNTVFYLEDDDVLLTKLTANQGTLVISKHPLNLAERDAVVNGWPQQGGFKTPPHYFSIEEHPNGFSYGDKTITFGEKNGRTTVKFTQDASAQEEVFAVTYSSQDSRNNANLVNVYEENPVTVDILKIDSEDNTKKLSGAVFTLRQLADEGPTDNGTFKTLDGTQPIDSTPTDGNGKTSFGNLTHGYYEVTEKTAPDGYVMNGEAAFYFKIDSGEVVWLEKGSGKPSTWVERQASTDDAVSFEAVHAAVAADPANGIEAAHATNATFTVENTAGTALPHTGGHGTIAFTLVGLVMVIAAGCVLFCGRRVR